MKNEVNIGQGQKKRWQRGMAHRLYKENGAEMLKTAKERRKIGV